MASPHEPPAHGRNKPPAPPAPPAPTEPTESSECQAPHAHPETPTARDGPTASDWATDEPPSEMPVADGEGDAATDADGRPLEPAQSLPALYSVFTAWEKRMIVLAVSVAAFFSPVTAQIYLPALNVIAADFRVTSAQINLTMTTYMILQGITPMFVGGLADGLGRRPAYMVCFLIYIVANIGLALCKNYATLMVVRCLQSAGSSSTIALSQAVVADIVTSAERGQYVGFTVLPVVLAPTLGPIIGGVLSQYLGWRSIFWFLAIAAAVTFALLLLFLPETCRSIVGNGALTPHPLYRTFAQLLREWRAKQKRRRDHSKKVKSNENPTGLALTRTTTRASSVRVPLVIKVPNPLRSLQMLFEKERGLLVGYTAVLFAGFYSIAVAMPSQYAAIYGYNDLVIGLMYIPTAVGSAIAAFVLGPALSWNYHRHARRLGLAVDRGRQADLSDFPIERARLEIGIPMAILSTAALLCWGWVLEQRVHVAVPCVVNFFYGIGLVGFTNTLNVLLIDVSPGQPGAAVAANNLARCLLGAAFSAAIVPMIDSMGLGWAFFLLGALTAVLMPLLYLLMRNGIQYRREQAEKEARRRARKRAKRRGGEAAEAAGEVEEMQEEARNEKDNTQPEKGKDEAEAVVVDEDSDSSESGGGRDGHGEKQRVALAGGATAL